MSTHSVSYFVRYEGQAENQEEFIAHYRDYYAPILARFPGIKRIVLHAPTTWRDPFPLKTDRFALLAQMIFDSQEDLNLALQSDERATARKDFSSLPRFHGMVYHQATVSEEVFSK
jgi:uncharacterized protein (TIGR02118 family)